MATHNKIVYIYIQGFDLEKHVAVQRQKQEAKGREFIAVQYTQEGKFEPELPLLDGGTKVIVEAHCDPMSDSVAQLTTGGIQLSYQTIANELAKKMTADEERVRISLYGCDTGVGVRRDSHGESFAGKLFKALVEKGLKPNISANLSPSNINSEGRLSRIIRIKKSHILSEIYHQFAGIHYGQVTETYQNFKRFHTFQQNNRTILDFKAQGSKVTLSYTEDHSLSPAIHYPYGHPNNELKLEALNGNSGFSGNARGKAGLQWILFQEILFAQNLREKMEKSREELEKIFENFEKEHPYLWENNFLGQDQYDEYNMLKSFLLTEDYYIDATTMSRFVAEIWETEEESREELMRRIETSEVLNHIKIESADYTANTKLYYDPDLGYLQLGLNVVKNKIVNYPSPISNEAFARLRKHTQEQLAIELGKQLVCHHFDNEWVQHCIEVAEEPTGDCKIVARDSFYIVPLEQRIVLELGKKQQGQAYDVQFIQFIQDYSLLVPWQIAIVGELFIEAGYHEGISSQGFNLLSRDQQERLTVFLGSQLLNYSFSSEDEEDMNAIIDIATDLLFQKQHQQTAIPQSTQGIAANSQGFFAPVFLDKKTDQRPEKRPQQQLGHCTIS